MKYMKKYPCVYMRGGTSKAVIFHEKDLPEDKSLWDDIFLKVMGTPDVKQIDGMGGTVSSTSKIAVIAPSKHPGADVDYTFRQVDIVIPNVDHKANCGNIASAVGPFAIDEGLVPAVEPETIVRVFNTNTNKIIEEHIQVENGHAKVHGDEVIRGVPGTGSRIDLFFMDPGGAATGKTPAEIARVSLKLLSDENTLEKMGDALDTAVPHDAAASILSEMSEAEEGELA